MAIETTYVVIDTNLITNDMIIESIGTDVSYRVSLDGSKAILKFNIKHPNDMAGLTKYTNAEIVSYLNTNKASWVAPGIT